MANTVVAIPPISDASQTRLHRLHQLHRGSELKVLTVDQAYALVGKYPDDLALWNGFAKWAGELDEQGATADYIFACWEVLEAVWMERKLGCTTTGTNGDGGENAERR